MRQLAVPCSRRSGYLCLDSVDDPTKSLRLGNHRDVIDQQFCPVCRRQMRHVATAHDLVCLRAKYGQHLINRFRHRQTIYGEIVSTCAPVHARFQEAKHVTRGKLGVLTPEWITESIWVKLAEASLEFLVLV